MSYPEGWSTQAATAPWTGEALDFRAPSGDFMYDPTRNDHLFLAWRRSRSATPRLRSG